ncbi:MAG: ring-hydroxylating dioxygenase, large terminal subunit [Acidimicrobiales bacterium]|nr:ring-hydroxylating dioxygenase, large terminal subunit [Acidimicrobiales bacterium]
MPFNWFKVAMPNEVVAGEVLNKRFFGAELVLWRDGNGDITCQEAYYPHLGASMAVGGGSPPLTSTEKPILGWRRWFSQFYVP